MLNPSESDFRHWRRSSTNATVVWSRRRRRLLRVMVALPRWRWQPAWRRARSGGSEGIGAGRAFGADSATGGGPQAGNFQKPALAKAGEPTLLPDLEALVEPTTRGDPR